MTYLPCYSWEKKMEVMVGREREYLWPHADGLFRECWWEVLCPKAIEEQCPHRPLRVSRPVIVTGNCIRQIDFDDYA